MDQDFVLQEAQRIVSGDRQTNYGKAEDSLGRIAALWSVWLCQDISDTDVAMMMVLLKVAREKHSHKQDNLVDICGYAALADRIA